MPAIGPIPAAFWESVSMRACDPEVVYLGPAPADIAASRRIGSLFAPHGHGAFIYLLLGCDGAVLYAGKARQPANRIEAHRRQKDWWDEVTSVLLMRVTGPSRGDADRVALFVEALAIRRLDPVYNIAGVSRRGVGVSRGVYA